MFVPVAGDLASPPLREATATLFLRSEMVNGPPRLKGSERGPTAQDRGSCAARRRPMIQPITAPAGAAGNSSSQPTW